MPVSALTFPFSAIVAQERMKRALLVNGINPRIGGVLVMGQRGSAKSTAARALANLLPSVSVRAGCPIGCEPHASDSWCPTCLNLGHDTPIEDRPVPFVSLPLGATEDRVVGTLDLEGAIAQGKKQWEPGLLARAHRGILYIDEVNLLPDHLMDLLLDVAASGINTVEREGISLAHPSRFLLVGTMNPDEGDLRPQLLDRFSLCVEVETILDPELRTEVVSRTLAFEHDPETFWDEWREAEHHLRNQLGMARKRLPEVEFPEGFPRRIAELCCQAGVEGLRADIVLQKTALALAALDGCELVRECDVEEAAELALAHRRKPLPEPPPNGRSSRKPSSSKTPETSTSSSQERKERDSGQSPKGSKGDGQEEMQQGPESPPLVFPSIELRSKKSPSMMGRHREQRRTPVMRGPIIGSTFPHEFPIQSLALAATIRAAACRRVSIIEGTVSRERLEIALEDFRAPLHQGRSEWFYLFVVDASGSMAAKRRMEKTKELLYGLLETAYRKRDRVALMTFSGAGVRLVLPPTRSIRRAQRYLQSLPVGGRTPMAEALVQARHVAVRSRIRLKGLRQAIIVVSDGRNNVSSQDGDPLISVTKAFTSLVPLKMPVILLDAEEGPVHLGLMARWAQQFGFMYSPFSALKGGTGAQRIRYAASAPFFQASA